MQIPGDKDGILRRAEWRSLEFLVNDVYCAHLRKRYKNERLLLLRGLTGGHTCTLLYSTRWTIAQWIRLLLQQPLSIHAIATFVST